MSRNFKVCVVVLFVLDLITPVIPFGSLILLLYTFFQPVRDIVDLLTQ